MPADYGSRQLSPRTAPPNIINGHDDCHIDDDYDGNASNEDEDISPPDEDPPEENEVPTNEPDVYISELPSVEPPQEYEHSLEDLASMDMLDLDDVQSISEMLDWTLNATM